MKQSTRLVTGHDDRAYLESVVGPGAELHDAGLLVEGEVLDVDLARGLVDGGRAPLHAPRVVQRRLGGQRHLEVAVRTALEHRRNRTYILVNYMRTHLIKCMHAWRFL